MRHLYIDFTILLFSLLSYGAVSSVQVGDSSRQQGVVTFRVANPAQCTVTVYSDAALTQKVDDTNNAVFAGSESCARPYNAINGSQVTAVAGRRTSEMAADGKLHSRSLAVATTYWVRVVDLQDSTTATAAFTTANIPWGDTHIELPQPNNSAFGGWAYPDLDWTDAGANKSYVDPLTGVSFTRAARNQLGWGGQWGDGTLEPYAFDPPIDVQGAWTNAASILSTSTTGPFASYTGSAQAPIFLPFSHAHPVFGDKGFQIASDNSGRKNLDDIAVTIYGFSSASNVEDRKVLVCLAVNYIPAANICPGPEIEAILPTAAGSVTLPGSYPAWQFAGWNVGRYLNSEEIAIYSGAATVTNSAVSLTGNSYLPMNAAPGMKIYIGGAWYTIATIATAASFNIAEPGVNVAGPWYLGNFGVRIRKKTASANTINVSASFSYAYSQNADINANGQSRDYCSRVTFPVTYASDGVTPLTPSKQGRLCITGTGFQTLFILMEDGTSRFVAGIRGNYTLPMLGQFSPTDPYTFVAVAPDQADPAGGPAFWQGNYDYAACKFKTWTGNAYDRRLTGADDCIRWTNMNPYGSGRTVNEQINAALSTSPIWDATLPHNFALSGISGNYAVMSEWIGGQDGPCMVAIFDRTSFNLVKLFDSFSGSIAGLRWGGCHSNGIALADGAGNGAFDLALLRGRNYSGYLSGPFELPAFTAKSLDGGATWTSNTALLPGTLVDTATSAGKCGPTPWIVGTKCVDLTNAAGLCGANSFGVTGYQCVKLKLSRDLPCSSQAGTVDANKWPCTWNPGSNRSASPLTVQPGDFFSRGSASASNPGNVYDGKNEKFRVLSEVSDGAGGFIIDAQRWAKADNPTSDPNGAPPAILYYDHLFTGSLGNTHETGWTAYMTSSGVETWINLATPLAQTTWSSDETAITGDGGHNTIGVGPDGVTTLSLGGGHSRTGNLVAAATVSPQYSFTVNSSSFAGIQKSSDHLETYPTLGNWTAPTVQRRSLYWDWRHINPDTGMAGDNPVKIWNHTYTLVSGQQFTYKMDIRNDLHNHKERRPNVFSTRVGFDDISGPATGNVIDDSKPNTYCYAYKASECRQGSASGDLYVVAKNAWIEFGGCLVNSYKAYTPCASNLESNAAWMIEGDSQRDDPLGYRFRRITMGLSGPGSQYGYTSPHVSPDSAFALTRPGWLNGIRADFMVVKMPPAPATDSTDRTNYVDVPVVLGPGSGYVRIRFGYVENGAGDQFYCTTRKESCVTDASVAPFAFAQTDTLTAQDCRNGGTVHIPALSGRVLYYRIERSGNGTTGWVSGTIQVKAVK